MTDGDQAGGRSPLDTSMLLPPTYFTIPTPRASSHDPLWTRSALQEELERLRNEVVELRGPPQSSASDNVLTAGGGSVSVLNEVLLQQTNELNRLRSEMENRNQSYNEEMAILQAQLETYQRQALENEEIFDKRLKEIEEDCEKQIHEKSAEIDHLIRQHDDERSSWRNYEVSREEEMNKKISDKDFQIAELHQSRDEMRDQVNDVLSKLQSAYERIDQLKIFESWSVDRDEVLHRNEELERSSEKLEAANNLKQQRLVTLQDVLTIQEKEISRFGPTEKQETVAALLRRWREKVFSLLVQAESDRLSYAKDVANHQIAKAELERTLEHTKYIATTNQMKLDACQAEVLDEKENFKHCNLQLEEVRQTLHKITDQRDALVTALSTLRRTVESLVRSVSAQERELLSKTKTSVNSMNRRLQNVSDRIPVLKAQMKRLRAKEAVGQIRQEYESQINHLNQELVVVRADRDRLANNMEKDAEETNDRERNVRQEYETEINFLAQKCDGLLSELKEKSRRLEAVETDVADLQKYSSSVHEENDRLKLDLSTIQESREEAIRITTTQLYEEHSTQMSQLQSTLDEVRREHTTTVMTLRQMERNLDRAQSEHATETSILREQSEKQIANLQEVIRNLEAERNLLKASLRHEGLLRTRGEPASDNIRIDDFSTRQPREQTDLSSPEKRSQQEFGPHLANLIEEVRSLVRSVEGSGDLDISFDDFEE